MRAVYAHELGRLPPVYWFSHAAKMPVPGARSDGTTPKGQAGRIPRSEVGLVGRGGAMRGDAQPPPGVGALQVSGAVRRRSR